MAAPELRPRELEEVDQDDVPAIIVCALCGMGDCSGCESERTRSGVVAIVPWERPGAPLVPRLWTTARATTLTAEQFFEGLPDGPMMPAVTFALVCEALATTAMLLAFAPLLVMMAPAWSRHVALDGVAREIVLRAVVAGVPLFAALLVVAHVVHGLALDHGARRAGAPGARRRALRFGLYAAGWDLVLGPVGVVVLGAKEGARTTFAVVQDAAGLPTRAARAFARGAYGLGIEGADRAARVAGLAAIVVTFVGAMSVLAVVASLWLLR